LSPEHIDDGPETAPGRLIAAALPRFIKPVDGPALAHSIGLARIEERCEHFARWMQSLRQLAD